MQMEQEEHEHDPEHHDFLFLSSWSRIGCTPSDWLDFRAHSAESWSQSSRFTETVRWQLASWPGSRDILILSTVSKKKKNGYTL